MKSTKTSVRPKSLFSNPKYFGKHVLITKGSVYAVKSATQASRLFDQITKKTGTPPTVTFVPKAQSIILENQAWILGKQYHFRLSQRQ